MSFKAPQSVACVIGLKRELQEPWLRKPDEPSAAAEGLRQQTANLQGSRAQMRGIATHTQEMCANTAVATGMKGATKVMGAMNKQMAPAKQAKVIQEFQRQSTQMDMTIEMMSDAIDVL
ncbi:hypothetical protein IFM89_004348 [Coptis chinensis]|uniref:Uncharacterized protein n=1 Tax=Coptis chinensis TaxID=261450 RepID=A0A835IA14_9MAGN|nr:hypothetical protein IFM89_004348 [Coptis chinensis]